MLATFDNRLALIESLLWKRGTHMEGDFVKTSAAKPISQPALRGLVEIAVKISPVEQDDTTDLEFPNAKEDEIRENADLHRNEEYLRSDASHNSQLPGGHSTHLKHASEVTSKVFPETIVESRQEMTTSGSFQESLVIAPSPSKFTVPQPFSFATDKRAAYKNCQLSASSLGTLACSPRVMKHGRHKGEAHAEADPGNNQMSVPSRQSSQTPKAKETQFISTNSFNFQLDARVEKRKEFYSKLQEKRSAKEEEMKQRNLLVQKQVEEEILLLRKSLTFKASPMPDFYREGHPPKMELKKIPVTRPKSPKFSQQSRHADGSVCHRFIFKQVECCGDATSKSIMDRAGRSVRRSLSQSLAPVAKPNLPTKCESSRSPGLCMVMNGTFSSVGKVMDSTFTVQTNEETIIATEPADGISVKVICSSERMEIDTTAFVEREFISTVQ